MGMTQIACEPLHRVARSLTSRPRKHASVVETAPLVVAMLMDKPRTARALANESGIHIATVKRWLAAFEAAGVLTWDPSETEFYRGDNRPVRVWRLHLSRAAS